tara:strand:+ start:66 stop:821 length:756 start_codon:yes stop_codon:yes gene_type:complete
MINKTCIICDQHFVVLNTRKIYCSQSCKQKNSYQKNRIVRLENEKKKYEEIKVNNPEKYFDILKKNRIRNRNYYKNNDQYKIKQIKKTQERRKVDPGGTSKVRRIYYLKVEKIKNSLAINRKKRQKKWNERYYSDPIFRAKEFIKSRLKRIIKQKNVYKPVAFQKAFGIDFKGFKKYIEEQFTLGMTWSNYGKWHLDHIIPLSSFDLSDENDFNRCNHYTNFQPLWAEDNLKKSNKIITERSEYDKKRKAS